MAHVDLWLSESTPCCSSVNNATSKNRSTFRSTTIIIVIDGSNALARTNANVVIIIIIINNNNKKIVRKRYCKSLVWNPKDNGWDCIKMDPLPVVAATANDANDAIENNETNFMV